MLEHLEEVFIRIQEIANDLESLYSQLEEGEKFTLDLVMMSECSLKQLRFAGRDLNTALNLLDSATTNIENVLDGVKREWLP